LITFSIARVNAGLKAIRHKLAPVLLYSGVAVLGYATILYGTMLIEQRHLQALWRAQQRRTPATKHPTPVALNENGLTRISIPSIEFSAVVVEGTDLFSMLIGPGHLSGTALPGEAGNAVISAHRDTFFRKIVDLTPGDHIFIERDGHAFTYEVQGFRIVKPSDISVVAPTAENRLTLITCDPAYYPGPAPQRLVVISKLLSTPDPPATGVNASEQEKSRMHMERATIKKAKTRGKAQ
jgi:sortase A